jgi:peptide/nickel transport system substrate-binding protein
MTEESDRSIFDQARALDRRRFLQKTAVFGASLSAAAPLLASPARALADQHEIGQKTQTLKIRLLGDIQNLDPAYWATSYDEPVMYNVFEGLVTYKPGTFEIVNQLASSLKRSSDGLRIDFELKKGIQFHGNYGELTSEDVKFSFERIAGLTRPKPKTESPYKGDWAALKEVHIKDKYSGTIILNKPFAALFTSTLPVDSGYIVSKKAVEARGSRFATHPIGTGPYELVKWTPNQHVDLVRFAKWGKASSQFFGDPIWDGIRFFPIAQDNAANIALATGEVDFGQISLDSIARFQSNPQFHVQPGKTFDYNWIGMNIRHPKLTNINLRRAIRYGIDVPAIMQAAFNGRWQRATGFIAPGMPAGYWKNAPLYRRDVDKARRLLKQAGVSSPTLSFTYTEEPGSDALAQIAQANLKDVGINLNLKKVDSASLYGLSKSVGQRELYYAGYVIEPDPSWAAVWFTCGQVGQWNWDNWCNGQFDHLQSAALSERDTRKRTELYIKMQKVFDDAAQAIWIAWPINWYGFRKGLQPSITPYGRFMAWAFRGV